MSPNDLVPIPGGEFLMGQDDGRDEERPAHRVRVSPFRICRFQVTNGDMQRPGAANLPATSVSWFDAVDFCARLSRQWGFPVRLPTEAEWEFAARGGLGQNLSPRGHQPAP